MTDTGPGDSAAPSQPNPQADAAAVMAAGVPAQREPDVSDPAKLIRLGTMLQTLLAEVQRESPDEKGRQRLAQIHVETIDELGEILSEDLRDELEEFNVCCTNNETPSDGEIRVAQAQLVGWLQGLLRGMQASATAQAAMAQRQLMQVQAGAQGMQRPPGGPAGAPQQARRPSGPMPSPGDPEDNNPSGYL